ncbi:MAG: hypothetical protein KDI46_08175 [Alphaproteobacteria bacterium]|nr:hypothetical protein [Alphaproteobacteria bacterium]
MFSALTQLLATQPPRRAEESDTRQALQHHDPDYHKRRKNKDKTAPHIDEDGNIIISVEALSEFLQKIIKSAPRPETEEGTPDIENIPETQPVPTPQASTTQSANAAHAASAYASMQNAQKKDTILLETTDSAPSGPELDLTAADTRAIHALLEDLKTLAQNDIHHLQIERAESFLQSLKNAVNKAKTQI